MKRRTETDDTSRTLSIGWGDGREFLVRFLDGMNLAYADVRDASLSLGEIDHEDATALALFWADVASEMKEHE